MNQIHPVYLPFTVDQLKKHFGFSRESAEHVSYYKKSAENCIKFLQVCNDQKERTVKKFKQPRQVEKDERFWTAATLMSFYWDKDREEKFKNLLRLGFGDIPPISDMGSWNTCLTGRLKLFFEINLPSPKSYKQWLRENLLERQCIPYILEAAENSALEGPTQVDALLVNQDNGFAVVFEAKVLSDISVSTSFDMFRNQLARNIDVILEIDDWDEKQRNYSEFIRNMGTEKTLFVLLTPEIIKETPRSRFYSSLFYNYRNNPISLEEDLPHRQEDWPLISKRLGWLTWEDCKKIQPNACQWL